MLLPSIKSIWRDWRHLIVLGSFVLTYLIFFQYWSINQANMPIVVEYSRYLDYLSAHSPKAKRYADVYFHEHERDTIASKHFEHVCAAMTGLAIEDGFTLADFTDFPAEWCHQRSAYFSEFLQPQ